jgi:hypothetical protein
MTYSKCCGEPANPHPASDTGYICSDCGHACYTMSEEEVKIAYEKGKEMAFKKIYGKPIKITPPDETVKS